MKKVFFTCMIMLFLAVSCKKSNINDYQNYIGVWSNTSGNITRTLEVKVNGRAFYEEVTIKGNATNSISHNGKFFLDGSTLKIGFKKLTINKEPTISDGFWLLTMDSNEYYRN